MQIAKKNYINNHKKIIKKNSHKINFYSLKITKKIIILLSNLCAIFCIFFTKI